MIIIKKSLTIILINLITPIWICVSSNIVYAENLSLRVPVYFGEQGFEEIFKDPDLNHLRSQKAQTLARVLKGILKEVQFDQLNKILRNSKEKLSEILFKPESVKDEVSMDYFESPFPFPDALENIQWIKRMGVKYPRKTENPFGLNLRNLDAFLFFVYGESLSREELEIVFGERNKKRINDFIEIGLFVYTEDGRIRTNKLSFTSISLNKEEVIYVLADTPNFYEKSMDIERVYLATDSYGLLYRGSILKNISGTVVELGTGTAIQLIALAKLNHGITQALGFEIDKRSVNVSFFNAYLNGVEDKIKILEDKQELRNELKQNPFSLAIGNPPFMAMPRKIRITKKQRAAMPGFVKVEKTLTGYKINLQDLYPKSGWAGPDGLAITEEFLDILTESMEPHSVILIYSQFAGRPFRVEGGYWPRLKIEELIRKKYKGFNLRFEFFQDRDKDYEIFPAQHWASYIFEAIKAILDQDVAFKNSTDKTKISFLEDLKGKLLLSLRIRRISHFFTGYVFIMRDNKHLEYHYLSYSRYHRQSV